MFWSWYLIVAALLGAAGCSFFFALAESSFLALGRWRAMQLAETATGGRVQLGKLFESPQDLLATLVFGNTVANGIFIGVGAWGMLSAGATWVTTMAVLLVSLLIGCEVLPKILGIRAPEFWSLRLARPMGVIMWAIAPLRTLGQRINEAILRRFIPKSIQPHAEISEDEYQDLLELAQKQGALTATEKQIILQVLSLDERTASDVMKPRSQIACISDELTPAEMIEAARRIKHTRIPVYDETPDTIVGVLNARAFLLNQESNLEDVMEFPSFVPESMNLLQLFRSLQRQRRGLAIVLDEFGGTAGLVTMEDILEHMLGRFNRREANAFVMERVGPGTWRVSGSCLLEEFRQEYPGLGEIEDVDTMNGLFVRQMEYVPVEGETVHYNGLRFTARRADERRVHEMMVETVKK